MYGPVRPNTTPHEQKQQKIDKIWCGLSLVTKIQVLEEINFITCQFIPLRLHGYDTVLVGSCLCGQQGSSLVFGTELQSHCHVNLLCYIFVACVCLRAISGVETQVQFMHQLQTHTHTHIRASWLILDISVLKQSASALNALIFSPSPERERGRVGCCRGSGLIYSLHFF